MIPELLAVLERTWPYRAEALTVVDGALDAVSRSLEQVTRFGDRVIVESPGFPPFFDLLDQLGLQRLPVTIDCHGIVPAAFHAALRHAPAAVILQPRAQNPTGASMPGERAAELARLLLTVPQAADTIVIEDDHSGEISIAPDVSLGSWLPSRVLHVRSYSKTHGPDLRIAALGGPTELIDAIVARRMLGPGWTSRMLQSILHDLLTEGDSMAQVSEARRIYFARQRALRVTLGECGLELPPADGINMWLPVHNEREALVRLAAAGIRVAGGSPFLANEHSGEFIRVTAAALTADVGFVATALVQAAVPPASAAQAADPRWA
ncbi:aminotransferase class I/II-fold pyridoxal phosphate-dependent enzyme [Cryobacterium roopkundense]|uniref:aminotransferase class I/II-fold pyridoxal phosphate-dependent enzyme n=1 Tax=Cryobacterium roopkundense TaxID=1001240 RepID=UPI000AC80B73|nr:PLP-dependent aminotransferase family protein [Cryobacterium roopkundense]